MAYARLQHGGGAVPTTLTGSITSGATTAALAVSTGWPDGSTGPFYVVFDQGLATEEKVLVTSRTALTLTIATRAVDGTSASAHGAGAPVAHVFSATEADEANILVHGILGTVTTKGDLTPATGAGTLGRLAAGTNALPLVADSTQATGLKYAALTTAGIGDTQVTPAKLSDASYTASWSNYTPGIVQSSVVASTVTAARCLLVGHTLKVQGDVSATGAGTAGANLQVSLPAAGDVALFNPVINSAGQSVYGPASVTAGGVEYQCVAVYSATAAGIPYLTFKRCDVPSGGYIGTDPSVAVGIGGRIRYAVEYEVS